VSTTTNVLPLNTYPTGERVVGPVNVPDNVSTVEFQIQRCTSADTSIWSDPGTVISLSWDVSLDGGQTWLNLGGFSANGGIASFKGTELQYSTGSIQFPAGTGRKVRVTTSITGSPVKTAVNLIVS
jgi:hypothetical protein